MTERRSALLVVDVQKDFCPGGALPVPDGDRIVPTLNEYIADATARSWLIYASRDWHPRVTRHFQMYGGPWPPHCVQGTDGASFHVDLRLPAPTILITKGLDPEHPGYSAFEGFTEEGAALAADLRERGVDHLYVGGLATDYCVRHTVLDARRLGFSVTVLADAVAGIDVGDSAQALDDMRQAGAKLTR